MKGEQEIVEISDNIVFFYGIQGEPLQAISVSSDYERLTQNEGPHTLGHKESINRVKPATGR